LSIYSIAIICSSYFCGPLVMPFSCSRFCNTCVDVNLISANEAYVGLTA
jgi:hypothetical protein